MCASCKSESGCCLKLGKSASVISDCGHCCYHVNNRGGPTGSVCEGVCKAHLSMTNARGHSQNSNPKV